MLIHEIYEYFDIIAKSGRTFANLSNLASAFTEIKRVSWSNGLVTLQLTMKLKVEGSNDG